VKNIPNDQKYTKLTNIIPNGHKIFEITKIYQHCQLKATQKYTRNGIFWNEIWQALLGIQF
jgi:hypothetical protein